MLNSCCCIIYYTSIKDNFLKLKSEVGMTVLKSKQTRVVGIISTYVYSTSLHLLFLSDYVILPLLFTDTAKRVLKKQAWGCTIDICADYPYLFILMYIHN